MEWYLKVLKQHYADFSGRARRKEYWMFLLFNMIIAFAVGFTSGIVSAMLDTNVTAVAGLYSLAVLIPGIGVTVRRLHDTGKSGWYMLVSFIPLIGGFILLYFLAQDSAPGNNEYGPNPKGA